jgi:DinB superfamily
MITAVNESIRPTANTSRRAIIEALELAHEAGTEYWSGYSTPEFFAPMAAHWSPADHVRHLTRSMTPLLPVLRVPMVALRLAFGAATAPSRSYEDIERMYAAALAAGGTAGRFTPPPDSSARDTARRDAIMDAHSETLRGLTHSLNRWTETQLDAHRLPHPLLGKLTVREMMLFTLLHNQHHVSVAERRRSVLPG